MITPIPFDPHRFRSAAAHYLRGRPEYAPGLVPLVARLCGLDGAGVALDLGCGPGQLARALLPFVESVLAMDPEPEMLAVAQAMSPDMPIEFRRGSSQDLAPGMGPFRIAVIGRAFHWMDRVETARRLDGLIVPGGALVLFSDVHPDLPDNAWRAPYRAALDAAIGGGNRGAWRGPDWVKHEAILLDSPFSVLERIGMLERVRTPVAALVERAQSMSSTSRDRLGDAGIARLIEAVEAVLMPAAVDGMVTEVVESVALIARRA
jgi:SAM-dependent methyltransferase